MSNKNNTISWQYAVNFNDNEKKWEEVKTLLGIKMRVITKNPLLTMTMMDECTDCAEMMQAIESGDRSEYLYKRAQESIQNAATLEEAGDIFYKAFGVALSKSLDK